MFSNCLSKVTLQKNCQPLRGFPLPAENFSLQNFLRQKCEAFLASGFPLLHFARRKIQQKLSASFRGFPSGGSSLRSKVMRGAAYNAKPIFVFLIFLTKNFRKIKGRLQNRTAPLFVKVFISRNFILPFFDFAVLLIVPIIAACSRFFCAVIITRCIF